MANTTTTTQTADIPPSLKPYALSMLDTAARYTDPSQNPYAGLGSYYQATGQTPFAQFNPLQTQAAAGAAGLGPSSYLGQSAGIASDVARQAGRYGQMGNFYNAPQAQYMGFDYQSVNAPSLQNYQMTGPQQVGTQDYTGSNVSQYMSPYMQNVVDTQKQQAIQDYGRGVPSMIASGIRAGGRGGTREALLQSEAQRNLQNQLQGIQSAGSQQAFQNAQQQFNTQQQLGLTAQQANQQAGLTTGQANLNALLGVQSLGAQQGLTAQQLNQAARQQMQQMQLNQLQNLNQFGLTNAANQAQYGLQGANLGLQGLQQQLAAGQQLGNIGQNQFNQQLQAIQQQQAMGKDIYGTESDVAKARFADYQAAMNDPLTKLGMFSSYLRSVPIQGGTTTTTAPGSNTLSDLAGIGAGIAGLYNIWKK